MNTLIDRDLIHLNSENYICFKSCYKSRAQVYINSFKLQKDYIEQIIIRSYQINFNVSINNIAILQIFSINVNNSSNKEDDMKKAEINAV